MLNELILLLSTSISSTSCLSFGSLRVGGSPSPQSYYSLIINAIGGFLGDSLYCGEPVLSAFLGMHCDNLSQATTASASHAVRIDHVDVRGYHGSFCTVIQRQLH